jgi:hypothetical protein
MAEVVPLRGAKDDIGMGGAGGPEDPMLEQRVARLEQILERLEPKITEIFLTGAKQTDVQRLQVDLARIEGRVMGIDGRLASIPTTWQVVAILATLLIGLSTIIFTASKWLHP